MYKAFNLERNECRRFLFGRNRKHRQIGCYFLGLGVQKDLFFMVKLFKKSRTKIHSGVPLEFHARAYRHLLISRGRNEPDDRI